MLSERITKATRPAEIDRAIRMNEPVGPDHPFFTDLGGLRGEFEERMIYRSLNVERTDGHCSYDYELNRDNRSLVFIGGMRGTGKTCELLHYQKQLDHPDCFLVVFCSTDTDLNKDDMEYVDILILQLENLTERLKEKDIYPNEAALESLYAWFQEKATEVNRRVGGEVEMEFGGGLDKKNILSSLLGLFGTLKANVKAGTDRTKSIRTVLRQDFSALSNKFNEFVAEAAIALRKKGAAQDVLFIVDGLEKTNTPEIRRNIVIGEISKISQVEANTLFILPIELMKERQKLRQLTEVVTTFPNVKIQDRQGNDIPEAISRLSDLVYRRISPDLFADNENDALVKKVIRFSGGNPRELLRILTYANLYADDEEGRISKQSLDKGLQKLARESVQYITAKEWTKLAELAKANAEGRSVQYDEVVDSLLEDVLIYEYNDGGDKRPNPVITLTKAYQDNVDS